MAKNIESTVAQKTALQAVGMVTRVFLGVSIVFGFAIAGMMAIIAPIDGGSGSTIQPLKAIRIADAKSIMNADEPFVLLNYNLGNTLAYRQASISTGVSITTLSSNQPVTIIRNPNSTTNINGGGSTSFSIEPLPQNAITGQMIVLAYKLAGESANTASHNLTVCVGHTSVSTLYVGTDGSTYGNSGLGGLSGRTTNESCGSIKSRAMKITKVTGGTITQQPGDYAIGDYQFIRAFIHVARFSNGQFVSSVSSVTLQTEAPLYVGFNFPSATDGKSAAPAFITLNDQTNGISSIKTVCFPETKMDPLTGGPVYYFDTTGTPYKDIFLQTPAMTGKCSDVAAKGLKSLSVSTASVTAGVLKPWATLNLVRTHTPLGAVNSQGFTVGQTVSSESSLDPLALQISGTSGQLLTTVPGLTLSVTTTIKLGVEKTIPLCVPTQPYQSSSAATNNGLQFYDNTGMPYKDIFLTIPIACVYN